ncbi:unnamed protein product [Closterium sp. NIES-53]
MPDVLHRSSARPSPYTKQSGGLTERLEPASRSVSPVRTALRAPRLRPPPVPGTHAMALRPSSVPLRVPLPAPLESSLPEVPDPVSDSDRAASPTVSRLLATAVTDPSFEAAASSALVAELLDFAAVCRLDYASALVAESGSASPLSVGGECALGTNVLEDRQEDFECLAAAVPRFASMLLAPEGDPDAPDIPTPRSYAEVITDPYSSQWQAAMDAQMASWKSTGTYVNEVSPSWANIVNGMWIFRRLGVEYFHTFSSTPKVTTLRVLLHVAAQRNYKLNSLDFSTNFLQGSLHEEIWLRRPPGFTGTFPVGTQWSLRWPVYGLRQVLREWHDTLRTTLASLGFAPSTAGPSLFLCTDTSLTPFYVLVYVHHLVFATADTEALTLVKSELQKRHTCTDLGELRSYLGLQITRDRARCTITLTQSYMVHQVLQRFGFQFSSPQPSPLSTSHSLSAPPSDESVEPSGPYPELVGCLMYLTAADRKEARLGAGPCVGLHGAVPRPRAVERWKAEAEGWGGLHLGVSEESKGWELLNLIDNRVVTTSAMVFYETMSLEDVLPSLAPSLAPSEPADEDAEDVLPSLPSPAPCDPPLVADLQKQASASGDEGSSRASPVVPAKSIAGGRRDVKQVGVGEKPPTTGEQRVERKQPTLLKLKSTDSDVVEVQPGPRRSGRLRGAPERLTYHVCLPPVAFVTVYENAEDDVDLPDLDPDMHADPEHRWDIATITMKEALASWKGKATKAAMDEEIRSLIGIGT